MDESWMLELDCLGLEPGSAAAAANQSCLTLSDPMDCSLPGSSVCLVIL